MMAGRVVCMKPLNQILYTVFMININPNQTGRVLRPTALPRYPKQPLSLAGWVGLNP